MLWELRCQRGPPDLWCSAPRLCSRAGEGLPVVQGAREEAADGAGGRDGVSAPPGAAEHGAEGQTGAAGWQDPAAAGEPERRQEEGNCRRL